MHECFTKLKEGAAPYFRKFPFTLDSDLQLGISKESQELVVSLIGFLIDQSVNLLAWQ